MIRIQTALLVGVIFLASFFRFWQFLNVPPSLYWDEVSQGYNAYLIASTGKDEHQEFLPIARFQAFGDYKAPTNIYLIALTMLITGKSDFAVRFPSALLGTLTVLCTFLLTKYLFYKKREAEWYGLAASFLLAISPWHIQLSRASFEANIATFFTVLGTWLFFYSLRVRPWVMILSIISFVIGFYSFNAHRIFIPLFVASLFLIEYKAVLLSKKQVITAYFIGFVLLLPFILYFSTPESKLRFQEVNVFSDVSLVKKSNLMTLEDDNSLLGKLIHNRRVIYVQKYAENYLSFFEPKYLFFRGDANPRFSDQSNGELFLFLAPLLIIGGYALFWQRKQLLVILSWVLLAPVAAATAREVPHALRSETFIPTFELIASVGIVTLTIFVHRNLKKATIIIPVFFVGIAALSCVQFWHDYLVQNPRLYSADWQYGYSQVIQKVQKMQGSVDHIYFTNTYGRPYIYVAWYGNVTSKDFWKNIDMRKDAFGFYNVYSLGKYTFTNTPPLEKNALYVTDPIYVPEHAKIVDRVNFLNGQSAFVISRL